MARIRVTTMLEAPPEEVWAGLEDIASHVEWMADASEIRFVTSQTSGVGTTFECDTRIGPFTLTDVMEITEWVPGEVMGVRHEGVVAGNGRFTLKRLRDGRTRFQWTEKLRYPMWLGGPLGSFMSKPVLRWVWRRNLGRLGARF